MKVVRTNTTESDIFEVPDSLNTQEEIDAYLDEQPDGYIGSEEERFHSFIVSRDDEETWDLL